MDGLLFERVEALWWTRGSRWPALRERLRKRSGRLAEGG
jgi:hypothetical protein